MLQKRFSYTFVEDSFLRTYSMNSIIENIDNPRNKPRVPPTSPIKL